MRKLSLCLVLLTMAAARLLAAPELPILDASKVTAKQLDNGLRVVVKEERQWPVVALGVYIRAGSLYEGPGENGVAHLVEHMLFETTGGNHQKLAPYIESLGGRIAATTLRDFVHLDIVVASRYLEQVLPVITRAVFEADFTKPEMDREMAVIKREMTDRGDHPDIVLDQMVWALAYPDHPYGRPIGGTPATLDKISYDTATAFHKRFYVPNNMSIVVVGDVGPQWLIGRLQQLTAKYPKKDTGWRNPPPAAPLKEPRIKVERLQRRVSLLAFAWHAPSVADKADCCAMDLIYTILGQQALGRLNQRLVRQQKVLLSSQVDFLTQKDPGLFIISALVATGREEEAEAAILNEVQQLVKKPVTNEELARAKRLLYTDYAFTNESYDDQVGSMGFYDSIDSYRFALNYISQVMKVTPQQLQEVAAKYLKSDAYSLVVLRGKGAGEGEEAAMLP